MRKDEQTRELFARAPIVAALGLCPECRKAVEGAGAAQVALLPGAPDFHAACLAARQEREGRTS